MAGEFARQIEGAKLRRLCALSQLKTANSKQRTEAAALVTLPMALTS